MKFGQRLRELRKAKGIGQRGLAGRVGINFTYLSKLENGVMPCPGAEIIMALAKELDADKDELFVLAGKIPPDIIEQLNVDTIKGFRFIQEQYRTAEPPVFKNYRTPVGEVRREQDKFFQALIENSLDGIAVINQDLGLIYHNASAAQILGYESGELNGGDVLKLIHPDDMPDVVHLLKILIENPGLIKRNEARLRHKDGTWRIVECLGISLLNNPGVKGIVITFRDITERANLPGQVIQAMVKEYKLTESEHKVLTLMVQGKSNPQIAERLVLSTSTVRFHVSNILSKLGVTNRTKAVALAVQRHLTI